VTRTAGLLQKPVILVARRLFEFLGTACHHVPFIEVGTATEWGRRLVGVRGGLAQTFDFAKRTTAATRGDGGTS
jgi:hypothetical protein